MSSVPESLRSFLTEWFDVATHGNPVKPGVYRASFYGREGEPSMNLGYYYWDLQNWSGYAGTAEESLRLRGQKNYLFRVQYWQGLRSQQPICI